jgi:hypothetical protein
MLFKHLLGEIDEHYGDLILHTEVDWLSARKFHSGFKCIFQKSRIFFRPEVVRLHNLKILGGC